MISPAPGIPLRGGKNCLSRLPVDGHVRPPAAVDRGKACVRQIGKFRGVLSQQGSVGEFSGPCSPILCRNAEVIPAAAHVPRGVEIIPLPINGSHQPHVKARRSIPYHGGAVQSRLGVQKGQRLREGIADAAVQHQCRIAAGAEAIRRRIVVINAGHVIIIRSLLRQGVIQQQRPGSLTVALAQGTHAGGCGLLQRRQHLPHLLRCLGIGPCHGAGFRVKVVVVIVRHRAKSRAHAVEGIAQIIAGIPAVITLRQRYRGLARQKGIDHQPCRRHKVTANLLLHQRRASVIVQRKVVGRFLRGVGRVRLPRGLPAAGTQQQHSQHRRQQGCLSPSHTFSPFNGIK